MSGYISGDAEADGGDAAAMDALVDAGRGDALLLGVLP